MIRSFDGISPQIADSAYVDPAAVIIGNVVLEDDASVWPNATLRGDAGRLRVGTGSNVQDNAILHEGTVLEAGVTVGHGAIVHDATVEDGALIGMNAVVLDDARVGADAVVGAGAVVTENTDVPPAILVTGVPAEPKAELDDPGGSDAANHYTALARRYAETSERLG